MTTQSQIAHLLQTGNLPQVTAALGCYFEVAGVVEYGQQMGRQLGFPTANIAVDPAQTLPPIGGYATFVWVDGTRYMSATNIGKNPTVNGNKLTLETHLLDFDGDLYGKWLRVAFVERLGEERTFGNLAELQAYIQESIARAREILLAHT